LRKQVAGESGHLFERASQPTVPVKRPWFNSAIYSRVSLRKLQFDFMGLCLIAGAPPPR
jgi:hypothetical protein